MRSIKREKRKNIEKGKNRFWIYFVIFLPSSEERNKKSSKKSKKSKEIMSEVTKEKSSLTPIWDILGTLWSVICGQKIHSRFFRTDDVIQGPIFFCSMIIRN